MCVFGVCACVGNGERLCHYCRGHYAVLLHAVTEQGDQLFHLDSLPTTQAELPSPQGEAVRGALLAGGGWTEASDCARQPPV